MNGIDIVLLLLLGFGIYKGFKKGLFVSIASLIALVLGIYGAIHFSDYAANFLESKFEWSGNSLNIAAFTVTFIVIVVTVNLAGKALTKLANFAALGFVNKLLGGVFGLLKTGLILSILLFVFELANNTLKFVEQDTIENSTIYQPLKGFAPKIFPSILNLKDSLNKKPKENQDNEPETISV